MDQSIICPFTSVALQPMADEELRLINQRIAKGELFFQSGAPVYFQLSKAFISLNRVYVYAEIDGILFLRKETAIVERNQTNNPLLRIVESEIADFYDRLGLGKDGSFLSQPTELPYEPNLNSDELRKLFSILNKKGRSLVTASTAQVDELHNLLFVTDYLSHVHMDYDLNRLKSVNGKLNANTRYVLCDARSIPFQGQSVDAYFSFSDINEASKEIQKELYTALRQGLKAEASCVCLINTAGKSYVQAQYKSELVAGKLKPWKKSLLPRFYFHEVSYARKGRSAQISDKRSFGSQFSKA